MAKLGDVIAINNTDLEEFQAEATELKVQGYESKHYNTVFDGDLKQWRMIGIYEKESKKFANLCNTCSLNVMCEVKKPVSQCGLYMSISESEANK